MQLLEFQELLDQNPDHHIELQFANGETLPPHFHVTEVGHVSKDFMDCGGKRRSTESCMLQTLVANDTHHRLTSSKLAKILGMTIDALSLATDLPVEVEVQRESVSVYTLTGGQQNGDKLTFQLGEKQTACLAPAACKLEVLSNEIVSGCDEGSGCC